MNMGGPSQSMPMAMPMMIGAPFFGGMTPPEPSFGISRAPAMPDASRERPPYTKVTNGNEGQNVGAPSPTWMRQIMKNPRMPGGIS